MVPSEVLHVCASSPRRITVDPGGSSPTFPTCWLDCRQACLPCSLKIQSWLLAAVRFRTSRRQKPCQMQLRTQHQHFLWAVFFGSAASAIGYGTLFLRPLGMGLWSHRLLRTLRLLTLVHSHRPLVSLLWRVPSTSATLHGCRVSLVIPCARSQTLHRYPSTWTTRFRQSSRVLLVPLWSILLYLEVRDEFSLAVFFVVWWSFSSCGRLTWSSYCRWSWFHSARLHDVREPMVRPR